MWYTERPLCPNSQKTVSYKREPHKVYHRVIFYKRVECFQGNYPWTILGSILQSKAPELVTVGSKVPITSTS